MAEKIEYYGEYLSILGIAKIIGISRDTLNKYYISTGNIYEAEKICKKILEEKRASLVEYNGEKLAIQTIAKKVGIKDAKTLKKYYEQTGDIYEAIKKCNESKLEYKGEMLTLDAIAKKEGLKRDTLEKHFKRLGNIYESVDYCLSIKKQLEESKVVYKGTKRTITSIARELEIHKKTLKKYYENTGDIEQAIELYKTNMQVVEDLKILHKGEKKYVKSIAKEEGVAETTLRRYIEKYNNIDKAVFMARIQKHKTTKLRVKDRNINLYDLSIILGIKYSELINYINSGISIDDIKAQSQKHYKKIKLKQEYTILPNGQTLFEYCIDNGLNYSYVYRAINNYGKTLEEAVQEYKNQGSNVPQKWIFEKYGILLRHLMISNNVDIQKVINYMRKDQISMNEAIEKYIIRKNARNEKLDEEWMCEIYGVLTDENMVDEYDEFKKEFYIDEKEEKCISKSNVEIRLIERKFLLYEIAEAIKNKTFLPEEMLQLLQIYEIQSDEIETIFLDLYSEFNNRIKLGENQPEAKRNKQLNNIIRNWYYLNQEEREKVLLDNDVTEEEKRVIVDLSSKIVKHQKMLNLDVKEKIK